MIWASWPQLVGSADVPEEPRSKTARTSPASQRRLMAYLRPADVCKAPAPILPLQVLSQQGPGRGQVSGSRIGGPCLPQIEERQGLQAGRPGTASTVLTSSSTTVKNDGVMDGVASWAHPLLSPPSRFSHDFRPSGLILQGLPRTRLVRRMFKVSPCWRRQAFSRSGRRGRSLAGTPDRGHIAGTDGTYAVGTRDLRLTDATPDTLAPVPGTRRELMVWIWYPTSLGQSAAAVDDYLPGHVRVAVEHALPALISRFLTRDLSKVHAHSLRAPTCHRISGRTPWWSPSGRFS